MYVLDNLPPDPRLWHGFSDDFDHFVTGDRWSVVATDSGGAAVGDAAGGVLTVSPSDGTILDNDETYLRTTHELFLIAEGKPLGLEFLAHFAQANVDDANHYLGCKNAIAANDLVDDGAGMAADFSGAAFYTVDGDTTWRCIYSDGTTQSIRELDADGSLDKVAHTSASTADQRLEIAILPKTSTKVDIIFIIDDVIVCKFLDKTYASATQMCVGFGSKNGADAKHELLLVDQVSAYQKR
jgi:hypothetical protein